MVILNYFSLFIKLTFLVYKLLSHLGVKYILMPMFFTFSKEIILFLSHYYAILIIIDL